jgi:hypothetical protein
VMKVQACRTMLWLYRCRGAATTTVAIKGVRSLLSMVFYCTKNLAASASGHEVGKERRGE